MLKIICIANSEWYFKETIKPWSYDYTPTTVMEYMDTKRTRLPDFLYSQNT